MKPIAIQFKETAQPGARELSKVSRNMLSDQTYKLFKQAIISGNIPPGERLSIRKLAAMTQFSATPIRDALLKLEQDGIVVRELSGHFQVRCFSRLEIEQSCQLRLLLETYSVAEAMKTITEQDVVWLEENLNRAEETLAKNQMNENIELNTEFHNYIAGISKNAMLKELLQTINNRLWIQASAFAASDWASGSNMQHRKIIEGLKNKDLDGLKQVIKDHILMAQKLISECVLKE
jgi:DNA-binding GntR family transcriptional regulator